jgi:hypothetical protein
MNGKGTNLMHHKAEQERKGTVCQVAAGTGHVSTQSCDARHQHPKGGQIWCVVRVAAGTTAVLKVTRMVYKDL